jgi:molybdopterin molybdotransferase
MTDTPVMTVEQARELVFARIALMPAEQVSLLDALGRVLSEDARSDIDVAPFDNSAMDGFALRAADLAGASTEASVALEVIAHIGAGDDVAGIEVTPGQAARIMTGAAVPSGADSVVMVERTHPVFGDGGIGSTVAFEIEPCLGEHVRKRGEEVRAGDVVVSAGDVIGPAGVGLLASTGHELAFAKVKMRPGNPQTLGSIRGVPFFGLPGNPTSTYVGFEIFVRPALRRMMGFASVDRPVTVARLSHDTKKKQDRRYYLRGRVERDPSSDGYIASLPHSQSSALLTAAHRGNCLVVLPEGEGLFTAGMQVDCIRLDMEEGTV